MYESAQLLEFLASFSIVLSILFLIVYVFESYSIMTIAKNRDINNAWLAWVPVGNLWIMGRIADYHDESNYETDSKYRKKILAGFIGMMALYLLLSLVSGTVLTLIVSVLTIVVAVYVIVIEIKVIHRIFLDITQSATLFTVLSLIIPITFPIFLFICRNNKMRND